MMIFTILAAQVMEKTAELPSPQLVLPLETTVLTTLITGVLAVIGVRITGRLKRKSEAEANEATGKGMTFEQQETWITRMDRKVSELDGRVGVLEAENDGLKKTVQVHTFWGMRFIFNAEQAGLPNLIPQPVPREIRESLAEAEDSTP